MQQSLNRTYRGLQRIVRTPNNGSASTTTLLTSTLQWVEARSGSDVSDYRGKISRVQNATSSYTRTGYVTVQPGSYSSTVGYTNPSTGYKEVVTGFLPELLPSVLPSSKAYELALGNFLKDAGEAVSPLKGMVFLGELRDTLKMLRRPASGLRDGISTYLKRARRKRDRYGARLATKGIADMWLEYALGWQPLIGSIQDAAVAYSSLQNEYKYYRAFGKGTSASTGVAATSNGLVGTKTYWIQDSVTTRKSVARVKGVAAHSLTGVNTNSAEEIARLSGFHLAEFVPTIWELIPYSFVVDYFTNIGDILNSFHGLVASWRWTSASVETTASKESKRRLNEQLLKSAGLDYWSGGSTSPQVLTVKNYERFQPSIRLPMLALELPPLGFQWATMLSLIGNKVNA